MGSNTIHGAGWVEGNFDVVFICCDKLAYLFYKQKAVDARTRYLFSVSSPPARSVESSASSETSLLLVVYMYRRQQTKVVVSFD